MKNARLVALVLVAIPLLPALVARRQGGNSSASTKENTVASGHSITAVEQTATDNRGSIERQIKTLHEKSRKAALKGDAGFLEKYLTSDYLGIGGDGRLITKDQNLQMLKSGAIKYEAIDERDLKIRVYGDTAVVTALASVNLAVDGKRIRGDHRVTFVCVNQEGNWREASFQATPIARPGPRPGNNLGHDAPPSPP